MGVFDLLQRQKYTH